MKKKICLIVFLLMVIIVGAMLLPKQEEYDYLRLHIRANSNLAIDQTVKYQVKSCVVDFLTPYLCNVKTE